MFGGKSQESRVKSQESKVKSKKVKIRGKDDIQKSKVNKEMQHRNDTSSQSSSYLNHQSNTCCVTKNMQQVIYALHFLLFFF